LTYRFGVIFTKKIDWSTGDDGPTETITFVYGALGVDYKPQKPGDEAKGLAGLSVSNMTSSSSCTWCTP
jgi:hypothetical protein